MKSLIYVVIVVAAIWCYSAVYSGAKGFVSEFSRAITQATGATK